MSCSCDTAEAVIIHHTPSQNIEPIRKTNPPSGDAQRWSHNDISTLQAHVAGAAVLLRAAELSWNQPLADCKW